MTLLERGEIASGASSLNAGAIDSIGWGARPDLQAHLTAGSQELFHHVQSTSARTSSSAGRAALQAIHTPRAARLSSASACATLRKRGHRWRSSSTTREARAIEPGFASALLGAMYSPLRSQADPTKATRAFARLAERAGRACSPIAR